jgi:hypothetical protein
MTWLIIGSIAILGVVGLLYSRGAYYRAIFATEHFREVHATLGKLIQAESEASPSEEEPARPGGALTSAGLVLGVTYRSGGHDPVLHVSLSQQARPTTAAVANRFSFFLLSALNANKLSLDLFFTSSGVHHLVFRGALAPLVVNDFVTSFDIYRSTYRPLPFALRVLDTADG